MSHTVGIRCKYILSFHQHHYFLRSYALSIMQNFKSLFAQILHSIPSERERLGKVLFTGTNLTQVVIIESLTSLSTNHLCALFSHRQYRSNHAYLLRRTHHFINNNNKQQTDLLALFKLFIFALLERKCHRH